MLKLMTIMLGAGFGAIMGLSIIAGVVSPGVGMFGALVLGLSANKVAKFLLRS